jgi:phosphoglycolate phosphatase-like HAD superfamily hydrolase
MAMISIDMATEVCRGGIDEYLSSPSHLKPFHFIIVHPIMRIWRMNTLYYISIFLIVIASSDLCRLIDSFSQNTRYSQHFISSSRFCSMTSEPGYHLKKNSEFLSPYLKERMNFGKVTSAELEKYYPFTQHELEAWKKGPSFATGLLGAIISLEDVIIDSRILYEYSYSFFMQALASPELKLPSAIRSTTEIDSSKIHDIIGNTFQESLRCLGWSIEDTGNIDEMNILSSRFYDVFNFMLNKLPSLETNPGIINIIDDLITDKNEIVIMTSLPRVIATRMLERAGLVDVFKGRVHPSRLISLHDPPARIFASPSDMKTDDSKPLGSLTLGQHLIRSCCFMEKNVCSTVYLSANGRNILTAKRLGMNAVAFRGLSLRSHDMRVADKVVSDTNSLHIHDIYKVVSNTVMMREGPALQAASTPRRSTTGVKAISSPMLDRRIKNPASAPAVEAETRDASRKGGRGGSLAPATADDEEPEEGEEEEEFEDNDT